MGGCMHIGGSHLRDKPCIWKLEPRDQVLFRSGLIFQPLDTESCPCHVLLQRLPGMINKSHLLFTVTTNKQNDTRLLKLHLKPPQDVINMHAKQAAQSRHSSDSVRGNGRAWSQSPMCVCTHVPCSAGAGCFTYIILSHREMTQTRWYYSLYLTGGLGLSTCSTCDS